MRPTHCDCGVKIRQRKNGATRIYCTPCAAKAHRDQNKNWYRKNRKNDPEWREENKRRARKWRAANGARIEQYDRENGRVRKQKMKEAA